MTTKKVTKMRGSRTHGYGSHKKHRGAGSRGGRGRAGAFKHKKVMFRVRGQTITKKGFKSLEKRGIRKTSEVTINLMEVIRIAGDKKEIDLTEMGYDKVLGRGSMTKPLSIKARSFSATAQEKIEKAKGQAICA